MRSVIRGSLIYNVARFVRNYLRYICGNKAPEMSLKPHIIRVPGYRNVFCGYYDRSPFRPGNSNEILLHANSEPTALKPRYNSSTDLLLWDIKEKKIIKKIDSTRSWNWQQGARLFWLDSNRAIYNILDEERIVARVHNFADNSAHTLKYAVQDASSNCLVSLNYKNLSLHRPDYGYRLEYFADVQPSTPYLRISNFLNTEEVIIGWEEAASVLGITGSSPFGCRINHAMISPDEKHVVFLLRYGSPSNDSSTTHFLLVYSIQEKRLSCVLRDCMVSHYAWSGHQKLIVWGNIDNRAGYYQVKLDGTTKTCTTALSDGHPFVLDRGKFVTDTYPDTNQRRSLNLVTSQGQISKLASFIERPPLDIAARCDFHPSLSSDLKIIQIDLNQNGSREVAIIDLSFHSE